MTFNDFFQSIIIGISIAAIPGPIFFELVRRTLARGFWAGALLAVGEFFGNFLCLLLIFFGVSHFFTQEIVQITLFLAGATILITLAVKAFKLKERDVQALYGKSINSKSSIATGFLIGISSPIVIALWISISGSYLSKFSSPNVAVFNIFLISLGFIITFFSLAALVHQIRRKISPKYVIWLSRVFGVILFAYGLYFLYELTLILFE